MSQSPSRRRGALIQAPIEPEWRLSRVMLAVVIINFWEMPTLLDK